MLMLQVKHWSARFAQKEPTVLVVACGLITGIHYLLDLKVVPLMHIIKGMDMTVNISRKKKVVIAQSKYFWKDQY